MFAHDMEIAHERQAQLRAEAAQRRLLATSASPSLFERIASALRDALVAPAPTSSAAR